MITIPYTLVNGIILIPATANEKEGFFAFDTGAMQTAVNKAYFPEMHGGHIEVAKFSEEVKEHAASEGLLSTLRFSAIERSNLPVLIMDLMYVENALKAVRPDIKLLGTLGVDIIAAYTVFLDYSIPELILNPPYGFRNHMTIPMEFKKLPVIKVAVADRIRSFVLDTGANTCLLGHSFMNAPALAPLSETQNIVNIPLFRVGENCYENITAVISDISPIRKRVLAEGVVGYQILCPQRSILDFQNNRLIMERT